MFSVKVTAEAVARAGGEDIVGRSLQAANLAL